MNSKIYPTFFIIIILILYSSYSIYYNQLLNDKKNNSYDISEEFIFNNNSYLSNITDNFFWPLPGFSRISSYFGKRTSPTKGASTSHSGIDIPAPSRYKHLFNSSWNCYLYRF